MSIPAVRFHAVVALIALTLSGCSVMEQYHRETAGDKVPVPVVLAISESYPNSVIKLVMEQKMFDGHTRYAVTLTDKKGVDSIVLFSPEGQVVTN